MLENFETYWEATKGDRKEQQRLLQLIVARVWVRGTKLAAMSLRPNYHITLGMESTKPTSRATSRLIRAATSRAGPKSRATPVTSR